ncbi:hypothetical protein [Paenibacillus pini]|uniref:Uncharacterized protein n=1 Tax=Paenibacillus pini JCM 16418 TaxID=1236976 RepID=W7Z8R2_9BACL|nr:hypothetical protein [Paenibacillus pini]GAF10839.1 hypothetical protein JCM16418_5064 [Paenibacillus pini JCM 16418]
MKAEELKRLTKLVGGYHSKLTKKQSLEVILERQHKHNPILMRDEYGEFITNGSLNIFDYSGWNRY